MPELPDVEGFKRTLAKNALRKTIDRVVVSDARILGRLSAQAFASLSFPKIKSERIDGAVRAI
jgi:formamidopyrimidine-DNA glycosylase